MNRKSIKVLPMGGRRVNGNFEDCINGLKDSGRRLPANGRPTMACQESQESGCCGPLIALRGNRFSVMSTIFEDWLKCGLGFARSVRAFFERRSGK